MASYENVMRSFIQEDIKKNHKQLYRDIYQLDLIETDKIKRKHYTIPLHSLWNAINDVKKAYVSAKANKDAGNIKSFRLRYKKASKPERTFVLEPGQFSSKMNGFAVTPLGEMKSSELFGEVTHECRIAYSSITKKFVLCKPCDILTKTTLTKSNLIALDPGMRTFQNGYSPDGICYKFANTGNKKLNRIKGIKLTDKEIAKRTKENIKIRKKNNIIKHLITRIENVKKKSGHNYKKFLRRIRAKLTNMITDLHWKTANFLCRNFNTILVGKMSTTEIVKKERSVLRPLDKKLCIQLSHYKFRERLLSKAEEFGVKCLIVDESYTTQTCGKCGTRNLKVGGAKVFKCINEDCTFKYDRDYNAARNIYLKALSQKTI
jgi:IS605 OrfB family transposase